MRLSGLIVAGTLLLPALAAAEVARPLKAPGTAQFGDIVAGPATINDLRFARQVLPPTGGPITPGTVALAASKTVYLNKNGVTLQPGNNDARINRSTLATQATTIGAWNPSATVWTQTVNCMKDLFAAYDVVITETDPGAGVQHVEAVFGGSPSQLGMDPNVAGVSPFTQNCSVIENAIVFTFTQVLPQTDSRLICEIMAQEVAHAYGLDHELLASDPMTYLDYNQNRAFQNQTASCGEDQVRPCGINGSTCRPNQNSVTLLTERLGKKIGGGADTIPPTGGITSPSNQQLVPPGFQVVTDANDNQMVTSAKLFIDGALDSELTAGPFVFSTPPTLSEGTHRLKVEIYDGANTTTTQEITVTVKKGASQPGGSGAPGDTYGGEITGGCSTSGGGAGLVFGLALVGLIGYKRRRC